MANEPPYLNKIVSGDALNTRGFVAFKTVDYVSLLIYGLFWDAYQIWTPDLSGEQVTSTTWTDATPSVSTSWTDATPSVSTVWTPFLYDPNGIDLPY